MIPKADLRQGDSDGRETYYRRSADHRIGRDCGLQSYQRRTAIGDANDRDGSATDNPGDESCGTDAEQHDQPAWRTDAVRIGGSVRKGNRLRKIDPRRSRVQSQTR